MRRFLKWLGHDRPLRVSRADTVAYLAHLGEGSVCRRKIAHAALRFFYLHVVNRPDVVAGIPWPRVGRSLRSGPRWSDAVKVLAYLGRYTHRVGISNSRLCDVSDADVTFATRDGKTCTLTHLEFALRFLQHVLPSGLKKIRHYGLYAGGSKQRALALAAIQPSPKPKVNHAAPTVVTPDNAKRPAWRERCCPQCDVPLLVAFRFPRPTRAPWRPP
jgi:hypothetical protein